jgi:hypothetical protein
MNNINASGSSALSASRGTKVHPGPRAYTGIFALSFAGQQ